MLLTAITLNARSVLAYGSCSDTWCSSVSNFLSQMFHKSLLFPLRRTHSLRWFPIMALKTCSLFKGPKGPAPPIQRSESSLQCNQLYATNQHQQG